ncbi:MAG TPA: PKD domain-containing protein, partial [Gemmatimonadaceae bacterium]|nr:PKD domain-containing protein [Gemmatimonadaceae bacterium]
TVSFTDAGAADTHDAAIAWGDGQSSTVNAGTATSASATHAYAAAGFYSVTVTVRDDEGASAVTHASIIVYDAAAGRLTGAGWITNTAGAKTTFGVDVRYAGRSTPSGIVTLLAAQGAIYAVEGTSFDWMVVQGAVANVRGSGRLANGTPVGFLIAARDGKVAGDRIDRVRVKLWNLSTGVVLFDSEPGAPDSAPPAGTLGGGNVALH